MSDLIARVRRWMNALHTLDGWHRPTPARRRAARPRPYAPVPFTPPPPPYPVSTSAALVRPYVVWGEANRRIRGDLLVSAGAAT